MVALLNLMSKKRRCTIAGITAQWIRRARETILILVFASMSKKYEKDKRTRSIGESPLLSRHPAGHGAPGRATLHGVTSELSFRDPYPLLHINCKQDTIEQGQPEACL